MKIILHIQNVIRSYGFHYFDSNKKKMKLIFQADFFQPNFCIYSLSLQLEIKFSIAITLKDPIVTEMWNSNTTAVPLLHFVSKCTSDPVLKQFFFW